MEIEAVAFDHVAMLEVASDDSAHENMVDTRSKSPIFKDNKLVRRM